MVVRAGGAGAISGMAGRLISEGKGGAVGTGCAAGGGRGRAGGAGVGAGAVSGAGHRPVRTGGRGSGGVDEGFGFEEESGEAAVVGQFGA
ncbi:hypothetical protein GCM10010245_84090 [Streptomyces spectabilis]|nr:hypothetical protein GCM10010245_84090 [Streptomyces spectabilis]